MSLGFLSFMTMGVVRSVTFRPLEGKARTKAIQIHAILQVLALTCMFAGLAAIILNKVIKPNCSQTRDHISGAQTGDAVQLHR